MIKKIVIALPQPVFVRDALTGEYRLTDHAKKVLKDIKGKSGRCHKK